MHEMYSGPSKQKSQTQTQLHDMHLLTHTERGVMKDCFHATIIKTFDLTKRYTNEFRTIIH